jgi:F-type H+/Na+-transporting ATPase subunit alpha
MSTNYLTKKFEEYLTEIKETGFVEMVAHPIAQISGLPQARSGEVVVFETGELGLITSIDRDFNEVLVFSENPVALGIQVARTNEILGIPVGKELLGTSLNPLGKALYDNMLSPHPKDFAVVDTYPLGIEHRERVTSPFVTGVTVVDLMIPLGKGQRELILGDRKTGKTEFLLQTMLTQAKSNTICIYTCIGKKKTDIMAIEAFVEKNKINENTLIVATSSSDSLGLIYLTPYSAMAVAEYFNRLGNDVLIILDDLTTHAKFYREISLLSKKFPGRASYPGDIFYTHARLLERAGNFKTQGGVNSITCLPVAETLEGDISGYIQTNLMSITDGHVFFDPNLFNEGRRPAVNYFLSVTRVGRQTQSKLRWGINRELNSFLSLFEKTQRFVHFGAELNEGIRATLSMGDRVLSFFDQPMGSVLHLNVQIVMFCLIWAGFFNDKNGVQIKQITQKAIKSYDTNMDFKKNVDELVESVKEFNELLGKIGAKSKYFIEYFGDIKG